MQGFLYKCIVQSGTILRIKGAAVYNYAWIHTWCVVAHMHTFAHAVPPAWNVMSPSLSNQLLVIVHMLSALGGFVRFLPSLFYPCVSSALCDCSIPRPIILSSVFIFLIDYELPESGDHIFVSPWCPWRCLARCKHSLIFCWICECINRGTNSKIKLFSPYQWTAIFCEGSRTGKYVHGFHLTWMTDNSALLAL